MEAYKTCIDNILEPCDKDLIIYSVNKFRRDHRCISPDTHDDPNAMGTLHCAGTRQESERDESGVAAK